MLDAMYGGGTLSNTAGNVDASKHQQSPSRREQADQAARAPTSDDSAKSQHSLRGFTKIEAASVPSPRHGQRLVGFHCIERAEPPCRRRVVMPNSTPRDLLSGFDVVRTAAQPMVRTLGHTALHTTTAEARVKAEAEEAARVKAYEAAAKAEEEEARAKAAARTKAEEAEAARLKAETEEAARLEAEEAEAARLKAEAEEAARLQAEEAEAARLKAEAEEAARLEAEEAEAARLKAKAEEAARLEAEEAESARLKAEAEEAARLEVEEAEAARVQAEEAEVARLKAEAEKTACLEAEEAEAARVRAEETEAARVQAKTADTARVKADEAGAARMKADVTVKDPDQRDPDGQETLQSFNENRREERLKAARAVAARVVRAHSRSRSEVDPNGDMEATSTHNTGLSSGSSFSNARVQQLENELELQRELVRLYYPGLAFGDGVLIWRVALQVSSLQQRLAASEARNQMLRQYLTDSEAELNKVRDGIVSSGPGVRLQPTCINMCVPGTAQKARLGIQDLVCTNW